jgi:hypothetical protein
VDLYGNRHGRSFIISYKIGTDFIDVKYTENDAVDEDFSMVFRQPIRRL